MPNPPFSCPTPPVVAGGVGKGSHIGPGGHCQPYDLFVLFDSQLSDCFGQLVIAFLKQLLLEVVPVFARPAASHQCFNDINDGKPPFALMQGLSDALAFKNGVWTFPPRSCFPPPPLLVCPRDSTTRLSAS
jgi:hypothetical protein